MTAEPATPRPCPFCHNVLTLQDRPLIVDSDLTVAFRDHFPSAAGHTLVIPRRHVSRLVDLTEQEYADLFTTARGLLTALSEEYGADALTFGVNDGAAAGQTVPHVHLHLIPRHHGDVAEVRGGLRWVLPATAAYWDTSSS